MEVQQKQEIAKFGQTMVGNIHEPQYKDSNNPYTWKKEHTCRLGISKFTQTMGMETPKASIQQNKQKDGTIDSILFCFCRKQSIKKIFLYGSRSKINRNQYSNASLAKKRAVRKSPFIAYNANIEESDNGKIKVGNSDTKLAQTAIVLPTTQISNRKANEVGESTPQMGHDGVECLMENNAELSIKAKKFIENAIRPTSLNLKPTSIAIYATAVSENWLTLHPELLAATTDRRVKRLLKGLKSISKKSKIIGKENINVVSNLYLMAAKKQQREKSKTNLVSPFEYKKYFPLENFKIYLKKTKKYNIEKPATKPASKYTIAKWIKENLAGIGSTDTAHSTRGVLATKAYLLGVKSGSIPRSETAVILSSTSTPIIVEETKVLKRLYPSTTTQNIA
ncbi:hypothetical protein BB558_006847 [Smittium angustum]|uniref:Uncharacterized protein n=1 Tax=Smittium angustum TaxID=133377 RepID=A0A2U1IWK5_SMIAN|nr:hypothetical protein BB558_006847 [Smittium angustum]